MGLISPPEKMSQNHKSKEDNVISLSFCVVLPGSVAQLFDLLFIQANFSEKSLRIQQGFSYGPFLGSLVMEEREREKGRERGREAHQHRLLFILAGV